MPSTGSRPRVESQQELLNLRKFEADNQGNPNKLFLSFLITHVPKDERSKKQIVCALGVLVR